MSNPSRRMGAIRNRDGASHHYLRRILEAIVLLSPDPNSLPALGSLHQKWRRLFLFGVSILGRVIQQLFAGRPGAFRTDSGQPGGDVLLGCKPMTLAAYSVKPSRERRKRHEELTKRAIADIMRAHRRRQVSSDERRTRERH